MTVGHVGPYGMTKRKIFRSIDIIQLSIGNALFIELVWVPVPDNPNSSYTSRAAACLFGSTPCPLSNVSTSPVRPNCTSGADIFFES